MRTRRIGFTILLLAMAGARQQPDVRIIVVVNSANPVSSMSREKVAQIFLRQMVVWGNGDEVLPVDQIERAPARAAFARDVQLQSVKALKTYWQQRIFSGDESPPPERVTDSDVLTYVRSNAGAIGYVLEGTELGAGDKAIVITQAADRHQ
jgi:ABC-type phosphate transport system substrate-binding protein